MRSKYNECFINFDFFFLVILICKRTGQFTVDGSHRAAMSCVKLIRYLVWFLWLFWWWWRSSVPYIHIWAFSQPCFCKQPAFPRRLPCDPYFCHRLHTLVIKTQPQACCQPDSFPGLVAMWLHKYCWLCDTPLSVFWISMCCFYIVVSLNGNNFILS